MKISQFPYKVLNYGTYQLGCSYQEILDIGQNVKAAIYHRDLIKMKQKMLSIEECLSLQIYVTSIQSRLFIFQDYSFTIKEANEKLFVQLLPLTDKPSSCFSLLMKGCLLRISRAIMRIALNIFISFFWIPIFSIAFLNNPSEIKKQIFNSWQTGRLDVFLPHATNKFIIPKDSHFTYDDILKIGDTLLGYRHVSTNELAVHDVTYGVTYGCSLNISFCKSESPHTEAKFHNLNLKTQQNNEDCNKLIQQYEDAITHFIITSIDMDISASRPLKYKETF